MDTSWDFGSYAVSYADATQNFRFTKARKSYNIAVKVFDDTVTTDANGNAVSDSSEKVVAEGEAAVEEVVAE